VPALTASPAFRFAQRFPGFDPDAKELDGETHKKYIFGGHVAEYMELLEEEDPDRYQSQFSSYISREIEGDMLEEMYKKCHTGIRDDPEFKPTEKKDEYPKVNEQVPKTLAERKATVAAKKAAMRAALEAAESEEDEEDDDEE